eukprot:764308-Hanusia_phi.AAC.3
MEGRFDQSMANCRLIHACKNRGWAEMSNFCYEFAQETDNLEVFVFDELKQLERILLGKLTLSPVKLLMRRLLADDLFLMALVTGKKQVPEEFEVAIPACGVLSSDDAAGEGNGHVDTVCSVKNTKITSTL